ncbi:MAG: DUF1178 family protein [Proteobacteria bacterium]|nr:DUF1178 family protein [Pseudomonadota bacterium]
MIVFDLICQNDHEFESWFQNSDAFEKLVKAKHVVCPVCGDTKIGKSLMAPAVSGTKKKSAEKMAISAKAAQQMGQYMQAVKEMRQQVEKNCDYVGEKFPEEARKMHYGEAKTRNIYGEATDKEAEALKDEGVEVQRIPWTPAEDA